MLPPKAIEEFKTIYQKQYGVELSEEEAAARAYMLFNAFKQVIFEDVDNYELEATK